MLQATNSFALLADEDGDNSPELIEDLATKTDLHCDKSGKRKKNKRRNRGPSLFDRMSAEEKLRPKPLVVLHDDDAAAAEHEDDDAVLIDPKEFQKGVYAVCCRSEMKANARRLELGTKKKNLRSNLKI